MPYTVKAVAEMAGVSIRALHHYDDIGLLKPTSVSPSGYRLYTDKDLERLQQVLFFRELGFGLQEIKVIIDSPEFDKRQALATHRKLLKEKLSKEQNVNKKRKNAATRCRKKDRETKKKESNWNNLRSKNR